MPIFAFTDIEGSTRLWEKHQDVMGQIIARHYTILEQCLETFGGKLLKKTGDGAFALFPDENGKESSAALECALEWQRRFQNEAWPVIGELRVRTAFHRGQAEEMDGDYYGPTANRTARLMSLGWGGQILVSEDLRKQAHLPQGGEWVDLGFHQVKDIPEPQHIFGLTHPNLALKEFPALKSLSNRPHNLPEQLSPFVGRQTELKELAALLSDPHSRCITLLAGAGMGKSRLGIQAALGNLESFKHGINRVSLEGLVSPDELGLRIAQSLKLGLYSRQEPREQLFEYLKDKNLLLILDPCERLAGALGLIQELLAACPELRVLACSRRRLSLRGAAVLEVKGLDYPSSAGGQDLETCDCVQLLAGQARGAHAGIKLSPGDRPHFWGLFHALRGMPLGLEWAVGWLRTMPLASLVERLEKNPRSLSVARPDLPEAHRGPKELFESIWVLLSEPEKKALAELTVFGGGFTLPVAQLVFQVRSEVLAGLVDQGLLEPGEGGRHVIPETARAFASAKLEEHAARRDEVLDLHARYFCRFLKERERHLLGYDQARAVTELRRDFPNIQRGWDRAVERNLLREVGQAARCLGLYTGMQGLAHEWEPRMERALHLWGSEAGVMENGLAREEALSAQAALLAVSANYLFSLGRGVEAREKMEKSLALCKLSGQRAEMAYALVRVAVFLGPEDERRRPALEEAASLYRSLNDTNGVAWARRNLGYLLALQGNPQEGKSLVEESMAVFRTVGNVRETAWSLNSLGQIALQAKEADEGMRMLREARDLFLGLGDLETAGWTLNRLGQAAMQQRLWDEARTLFENGLKLFGHIRQFRGRAQALRGLCALFAEQGNLAAAFQVVDKAVAEAQAAGDWAGQAGALMQKGHLLAGQKQYEEAVVQMQAAYEAFGQARSVLGQVLALEAQACARRQQGQAAPARLLFDQAFQAFGQAGWHDGEARVCVHLGDLDAEEAKPLGGEGWYQRALKLSRQNKPGDYTLGALTGLAGILHKQGRKLEALRLALLCERALNSNLMPASEAEFHAELGQKVETVLARIGTKLMRSVIDEARAKMAQEDARAVLKESTERYWC